jgi:hypothetical protein
VYIDMICCIDIDACAYRYASWLCRVHRLSRVLYSSMGLPSMLCYVIAFYILLFFCSIILFYLFNFILFFIYFLFIYLFCFAYLLFWLFYIFYYFFY